MTRPCHFNGALLIILGFMIVGGYILGYYL